MAVVVMGCVLFLALASYSDASYCLCNSGLSDNVLQKNIDYACGAGADCTQIAQNGPCFNPNTVRDHCNYAVNSYYQKKANMPGSCDFQGTAAVSPNPPSVPSGCVFPSGPSNTGGTTPVTPTTPGTPTTPTTPGTPMTPTTPGTPNMGGTPASPGTFPGSTVPGSPLTPGFNGLGPTGSGFGNTDNTGAGMKLLPHSTTSMLVSMSLIVISSFCRMI